jgi:hypothetical protein
MPEPSSKSFVEHVRTIHFALLVTSAALIIAMQNKQGSVVHEAAAELRIVAEAFDYLKPGAVRAFVKEALAKEFSALNAGSVPDFASEENVNLRVTRKEKPPVDLGIRFRSLAFSENIRELLSLQPEAGDDDYEETSDESPEESPCQEGDTLKSFVTRWDLINPRKKDSKAFLGAGELGTTGYIVKKTTNAKESDVLRFASNDLDDADEVAVESSSAPQIDLVGATLDLKSGQNLFEYRASELGKKQARELSAVSPDGKHMLFVSKSGQRWNSCEGVIWELGAAKPSASFTMNLGRNLTKPRIAIGFGGSPIAVSAFERNAQGSVYTIKLFDQRGAAIVERSVLLGKPPVTFGGPNNDLLSAGHSGSGVVLSRAGKPESASHFLPMTTAQEIQLTADGQTAVVVGHQPDGNTLRGYVWVVDVAHDKVTTFPISKQPVRDPKAAFSTDGRTLVVVADVRSAGEPKARFRLYGLSKGTGAGASKNGWTKIKERDLDGKATVACSPFGKKIAVAMGNRLLLLSGADFSTEATRPLSELGLVAFSGSDDVLTVLHNPAASPVDGTVVHVQDDSRIVVAIGMPSSLRRDTESEAETHLLVPFNEESGGQKKRAKIIPLDLQSAVKSKMPQVHWRNGSFDISFPSLAAVTEQYRGLTIDQVRKVIDSEIPRSGETVEAFGLKIPASALRQWGTLVILALQLYFSRHLRFMRQAHLPDLKASKSAWIGLYDDGISRFSTFVTTVILPLVACMMLAWSAGVRDFKTDHFGWQAWGIGTLSVALSLFLAATTRRELQKLMSELRG